MTTDKPTPPQADAPIKGAGEKKPIPARFLIDVPKLPTPAPIDADRMIKWFDSVVNTSPCVSGDEPEIEAIRAALKKGVSE